MKEYNEWVAKDGMRLESGMILLPDIKPEKHTIIEDDQNLDKKIQY